MNIDQLQDVLDRLRVTSWQRWLFIAIAVVSVVGASMIAAVVSGHLTGIVLVLVVGFAAAACAQADSHTALIAEGIVIWQWVATVDDVTTAWTLGVAICLLAFHTLIALMAVTPITAVVAPAILRCWGRRALIVAASTPAVWIGVLVLDQRSAPGSVVLTSLAFVTLTVLMFVARARSSPTDQVDTH